MCKKTQEGTEAQPQAHRNIHTFIYHPHFYTHTHARIQTKRGRLKDRGRTSRNLPQQRACHLVRERQILLSLSSKLGFLRMWACVSLPVTGPWHTLCAVRIGGGKNKVSTDYPPSENPQAVWRSARGLLSFVSRSQSGCHHRLWVRPFPVVTVRTQRSLWCVTNIQQSALHWNISQWGGAIISLGTAKPLRDLYLTGLAVWCMDTWGVSGAPGFQGQYRGFATKAIDKTTVPLLVPLLSCPLISSLLWPPVLRWLVFGSHWGVSHHPPLSSHWRVLGSRLILSQGKERAVGQVRWLSPVWPSSVLRCHLPLFTMYYDG